MEFGNVKIDFSNNASAKLKAIAKHAKALADELDQIDAETCPECGGLDAEIVEFHADVSDKPIHKKYICNGCGYVGVYDDIP